jgi:hypothetical protein
VDSALLAPPNGQARLLNSIGARAVRPAVGQTYYKTNCSFSASPPGRHRRRPPRSTSPSRPASLAHLPSSAHSWSWHPARQEGCHHNVSVRRDALRISQRAGSCASHALQQRVACFVVCRLNLCTGDVEARQRPAPARAAASAAKRPVPWTELLAVKVSPRSIQLRHAGESEATGGRLIQVTPARPCS